MSLCLCFVLLSFVLFLEKHVHSEIKELIFCVYLPVQVELSAALHCLQKVQGLWVSPPQMFHVSVVAESNT